jgi:hypothetical protein
VACSKSAAQGARHGEVASGGSVVAPCHGASANHASGGDQSRGRGAGEDWGRISRSWVGGSGRVG